jgi:glycosyltransferase involved in cell wall biosynthesis
MKLKELSVFFPAYNEEKRLEKTVLSAIKVLPSVADKWEVIIVNDGSKDKTGQVAKKIASKNKNVSVIEHEVNRGYGAALKSGLYSAKYRWITFIDSDGQFDFSEIDQFIETQNKTNADLVIGYYKSRAVPFYRKVNSTLWQLVVFALFGLKVRDIDCAFKLIDAKIVKKIPQLESERGAFISSELLIKAKKVGAKIVEIPVSHFPREGGVGTGASLNVIIKSFVDLFRLWRKLSS